MKQFASLAEVAGFVGQSLQSTGWVTVTQQAINLFADATGDHQWIHVDEARAKAGSVRRHHRPRFPHALFVAAVSGRRVRDCRLRAWA